VLTTVPVPPTRLEDYAEAAGTEAVERLREAARPLRGATLLHVNSTAFGGIWLATDTVFSAVPEAPVKRLGPAL
jgi:hypothetical protein